MKKILFSIFLMLVVPSQATVTITTTYAGLYQFGGTATAANTLWAMVIDDGDNSLTGMTIAGNGASLTTSGTADSYFTTGMNLAVGQIFGGGTVFAMGGTSDFNGAGSTQHALSGLTLGSNGLVATNEYALYWFPGVTYSGTAGGFTTSAFNQNIGSQVGGISNLVANGALFQPMVVPSDGSTVTQGVRSIAAGGSTWSAASMTAVQLVPEPSSFLLTALGVFGFVVRRRR